MRSLHYPLVFGATVVLTVVEISPGQESKPGWGIDPDCLPAVVTEESVGDLPLGSTKSIGGVVGKDLRGKDLTRLSLDFLACLSFDQRTRWPEAQKLPDGFSPATWLETGKDPGLGVRDLHKLGIVGEGISVAVFDKRIRPSHQEFEGRIVYREPLPRLMKNESPHFHGIACASILAGKTCGVAPGAKLYYFALPEMAGINFDYNGRALEEVLKINHDLPAADRIRVVSISTGYMITSKVWETALEKAGQQGVGVIYSNPLGNFSWGGCPPYKDRNDPSDYVPSRHLQKRGAKTLSRILVPGDYRTTASNSSDSAYRYWGAGGFSWAMPYVAGLAALAWDINPDLPFDEILKLLTRTSTTTSEGNRIIDPLSFFRVIKASTQSGSTTPP